MEIRLVKVFTKAICTIQIFLSQPKPKVIFTDESFITNTCFKELFWKFSVMDILKGFDQIPLNSKVQLANKWIMSIKKLFAPWTRFFTSAKLQISNIKISFQTIHKTNYK